MLFRLSTFLAVIATLLETGAASVFRRQCTTTLSDATLVANQLQLHYYNVFTGTYNQGELWTDANSLEDLHNLMLATGFNDYENVADTSYIGKAALDPDTDWAKFLYGSNDDAQWVILALWKIADYKSARGQDSSAYISSAAKIYDIVAREWDDTCGGGVWWSTDHTYKNAITNELFLLTSAAGHLRTKNETYLENANKEWTWLSASGLRGPSGLFNDGLDSKTCQNNGQTTWTYNQAVVASGLAALYAATGDESLLDQAEVSLDATMRSLIDNGILRESCDFAVSNDENCNRDQVLFFRKGIWTKHVQYYLDNADDISRIAKYSHFLGFQHLGVVRHATNPAHDVGSVWYAADRGGSQWSPEASASGLQALISAAKVRKSSYLVKHQIHRNASTVHAEASVL
ncbi:glycoside hydrolase family 76 protein [Suillus clintonianus]|uniref:glycoside hydrolase family 76 protein n=1 Tax=Suillus clintonianus TaxID=1904413 RepID=UPI001B8691C6|nr:glycoside hydrolase family 76 protein [Suillus clintonianus]KAG2126318.1 glycoside hydrolase family 76 protein [Suillus clintonianus]